MVDLEAGSYQNWNDSWTECTPIGWRHSEAERTEKPLLLMMTSSLYLTIFNPFGWIQLRNALVPITPGKTMSLVGELDPGGGPGWVISLQLWVKHLLFLLLHLPVHPRLWSAEMRWVSCPSTPHPHNLHESVAWLMRNIPEVGYTGEPSLGSLPLPIFTADQESGHCYITQRIGI